ncbi:MAG: AMP-binding protein [Burkholderiaceae bacterium]
MLIGDILAAHRDDKTAIIFEGHHISYLELDDLSNRFAHLFGVLGLNTGDRVSMLMGNEPLTVGAYFGLFKTGSIANPINNRLSAEEVEYVLNHAESRLLITTKEYLPLAMQAIERLLVKPKVLVLGKPEGRLPAGVIPEQRLYEQPTSPRAVADLHEQMAILLIYTSGTTGRPKGVLLTHAGVWADGLALSRGFRLGPDHVTLCIMPLFHCNALIVSHLSSFIAHSTVVLCRKFSAREHWKLVERYGVKSFSAPPTVLAILLEREAETEGMDINLEFVKTGSAPLTVELAQRFEARFGENILIEGWGLTEATATSTLNPLYAGEQRKLGSVGRAMPGQEVRVIDEGGRPLPEGEVGELVIRSNTLMKGYFRDSEATEKAMMDGWLRTGDLGRMDADGYIYLAGRKKEIIVRGGENISPLEVEEVISRHPAVRDVAVGGLPDRIWGEVVIACIVLASEVSQDELVRHCRASLADFKIPTRFAFTDDLPRNATGKILRRRLSEYFESQS